MAVRLILAALLVLTPSDCFKAWSMSQKAADCCKHGDCAPNNKGADDDCCKPENAGSGPYVQGCRYLQIDSHMLLAIAVLPDKVEDPLSSASLQPLPAIAHPPPLQSAALHIPLLI